MQQVNLEIIQKIIGDVIGNIDLARQLEEESELLGAITEIDSMGVTNIMLGMEEIFGFHIEDDEVEVEMFETVGSLLEFAKAKQKSIPSGS